MTARSEVTSAAHSTIARPAPAPESVHWGLDEGTVFLNHGSFGATPVRVLAAQRWWQERMERDPVEFVLHEVEPELDRVRAVLGAFVGAHADDLALIPNATTGVNTVLANLRFQDGDELLTTSQAYNACNNALRFTAERYGAVVTCANVPFPLQDPQQVVDAVMAAVTPRTRLFLLDHVTSPTGVVLPVETLVPLLESRGIAVLVDGAHAPGMVPLNLNELGASYYTGNCHKWLCTPKGSAFLHVRRDLQSSFRPLVISHGANATRTDRSRFRIEFDWTGTMDPTPFLVIPDALQFLASLQTGGIAGHMRIIRERALQGRHILTQALNIDMPAPDSMIGTLAAFPLPDDPGEPSDHPLYLSQLQLQLKREFGIQIPIIPWPRHPRRLVRYAVQRYNSLDQLVYLAHALKSVC